MEGQGETTVNGTQILWKEGKVCLMQFINDAVLIAVLMLGYHSAQFGGRF